MGDEGILVGVVDLDGNPFHVLDALGQEIQRAAKGRVVALHIGDLDDALGALGRRGDGVAAGERERQRLLAHDMQPGFERGHRERGMERIGGRDHHGIQLGRQQPLHVGIEFLDAIARANGLAHRGRGIGQCHEGEALALFP